MTHNFLQAAWSHPANLYGDLPLCFYAFYDARGLCSAIDACKNCTYARHQTQERNRLGLQKILVQNSDRTLFCGRVFELEIWGRSIFEHTLSLWECVLVDGHMVTTPSKAITIAVLYYWPKTGLSAALLPTVNRSGWNLAGSVITRNIVLLV